MTDEQLVELSQQGNLGAFNHLTSRMEASVFRFVLRTLGNREDARDICQEAFLKAYQNIERLRDGSKFKSWVHHIALNLCRDRFRSSAYRSEAHAADVLELDQGQAVPTTLAGPGPRGVDDATHLSRALEEIMARLPEEQRTAILLREYHGFTSEEIGEITGAPAATVRTRIFYGLRTLRRAYLDAGGKI